MDNPLMKKTFTFKKAIIILKAKKSETILVQTWGAHFFLQRIKLSLQIFQIHFFAQKLKKFFSQQKLLNFLWFNAATPPRSILYIHRPT